MSGHRLGLIVPSSNTVAERDFSATLPDGVTLHTARMLLEETTAAAEREMLAVYAPRAAVDLGTARCDVVVFSCTSAGALIGTEGERRLVADLGRLAGAEVVSTNAAVAERLGSIGARRIAVITAYVDELNAGIASTLAERGFEVVEIHGMGITENFAIAEVEPDQIVEFARKSVRARDVDAVFVSCTNLQAVASREALQAEFGVPVVTSNSAALDVALARMNMAERIRVLR